MDMPPLREVVANALRIDVARVTDDLEFNAVPEWDSLNHITLILALESEYGLTITDDQVVELTSYRAIRELVEREVRGAAA